MLIIDILSVIIHGQIEQGVSYTVFISVMGVMLGVFVTVVGFMFNRIQAGFKDAAIQRKEGFLGVGGGFDKVDGRFDKVDGKFDKVGDRFDGVNKRFDKQDGEITELKISQARIQALLEMSLLQKGFTSEQVEKGVQERIQNNEES